MNHHNIVTIGLDVGYGLCKAVASNGKRVCFESKVAPAEFIRFQADIGAPVATNGLTLHDTAEGSLFVGELATKQGRPGAIRSPRDRNRVSDPITTHLADAAFAMLLPGVDQDSDWPAGILLPRCPPAGRASAWRASHPARWMESDR